MIVGADPPAPANRLSRPTLALLAFAIIAGGYLRFTHLGSREMSADEGASWAAASASTVASVIATQRRLNPGKAGLHDLALHLWINAMGGGLATMRALSATAGTVAILLVFGMARELFDAAAATAESGDSSEACGQAAAIAALIFAVNLVTIKYSREVRMYPLVLVAVVAQSWCFIRAARCGGPTALAGVVLFTAMALATHVMALLAFTGEGLWLLYVVARNRLEFAAGEVRRAIALAVALGAGAALLAPIAPAIISGAAQAADRGAIDWIKRPHPWAPFALFNKATGSVAYPVMMALAVWGVVRGWRRRREAIVFALLWMWTPPLALMIVSYAIRPAFVERYLVSCFVPFFILVALGIAELRDSRARTGATVLVGALALGHLAAWARKPHDTQWREAAAIAVMTSQSAGQELKVGDGTIAVAPGYAVNVVRFYLARAAARQSALPAAVGGTEGASVAIVGDQGVAPAVAVALDREYPRLLAKLRGVVVRGR